MARFSNVRRQAVIELAEQLLAVTRQVHPKELASVRLGTSGLTPRSGVSYEAERTYPIPPLRDCVIEDDCANCDDYRRWRREYERWARTTGVEVLPQMIAPTRISWDQLAAIPTRNAPTSEWLALVASMIELARA